MYDHMIPTMQKVLGEIRDLVTTSPKRAILETVYTMRPTAITNQSNSTGWIWSEYYKFLSLNGLHNTSCFKQDFPDNSDSRSLMDQYIKDGRIELDR